MRQDHDRNKPTYYRIKIIGHLDKKYSGWLEGLSISYENGKTILFALIRDQPSLHGLLNKLRDLNLILVSIEQLLRLKQF